MANAAFYRREAERCRALAAATQDPVVAARWLRISNDYDTLADAIAAQEHKESAALAARVPMQQQPVQQQQKKKTEDET